MGKRLFIVLSTLIMAIVYSQFIQVLNSAGHIFIFSIFLLLMVVCVFKPEFGVLAYVFLSPHTFIMNYSVAGIKISNLFGAAVFFIWAFHGFVAPKSNKVILPYDENFKKFIVIASFSAGLLGVSLINGCQSYQSVMAYVFRMCTIVIMLLGIAREPKDVERILKVALISGLVMAVVGFIEIVIGRTFFYSLWTGTQRYRFNIIRMGSTTGSPNHISLTLIPLLPIAFYYYRIASQRFKKYYLALFLAFVLCICLTFSRMGWVLLLLFFSTVLWMHFFGKKQNIVLKRLVAICFMAMVCFSAILGFHYTTRLMSAEKSSETRALSLEVSYENFIKNPFKGVGFRGLEEANALYVRSPLTSTGGIDAMNYYLQTLAENGVVVFLLFMLLMFYIYKRLSRLALVDPIFKYVKISFILFSLNLLSINSYGMLFIYAGLAFINPRIFMNAIGEYAK